MPKLGLTMTEGTVARWVIAAGDRFTAGDVVAVIETDKIAYDIEAPASGVLHEILVPEGDAVPIGAPIGRWDIGGAELAAAPVEAGSAAPQFLSAPSVAPPHGFASVRKVSPGDTRRVFATPYARRLARIGNIDLRSVTGTGPRGRIKAADVNRSIAGRASPPPVAVAQPPSPALNFARKAHLFSAGVEVDVGRLLALNEEIIQTLPPLQPQLVHYVILAASRVLAATLLEPIIGLAAGAGSPHHSTIFGRDDCATLKPVVERASGGVKTEATAGGGTLRVTQANEHISFISSEPPPGWLVSLGVGSVRTIFRPDGEGRPVKASSANLIIACRAAAFDSMQAQALLGRIRDLLENPAHLLIS